MGDMITPVKWDGGSVIPTVLYELSWPVELSVEGATVNCLAKTSILVNKGEACPCDVEVMFSDYVTNGKKNIVDYRAIAKAGGSITVLVGDEEVAGKIVCVSKENEVFCGVDLVGVTLVVRVGLSETQVGSLLKYAGSW